MTKLYRSFDTEGIKGRPVVLAIGSFNGLHRGHISIISRVVEMASLLGKDVIPTIISFHPHPSVALGRVDKVPQMIALREKVTQLDKLSVAALVLLRFHRELSLLTAEQFLDQYVFSNCQVRGVVLGPDSAIGRGREGTVERLVEIFKSHGSHVEVAEELADGPQRIRSRTLSQLITGGELSLATHLLGREYSVLGRVVRGDGRGKGLGFPTANLHTRDALLPPNGVYSVCVEIANRSLQGVVNIGMRPTFDGDSVKVELHILDFEEDIYGKLVKISLVNKIRDERKFNSVSELKEQIALDCSSAREDLKICYGR